MSSAQLGRYRILQPLGEGGMGEVFLAHDDELDRKVALKVMSTDLAEDETARRRFLREARSAAAIDHPYVCKIYEIGEAEDRAFIAMEYVDGETLRERLGRGPLRVAEALRLVDEIAEALAAAHRLGVVHRDLKPANVMIAANGHVKLLDFGLAKRVATRVGGEDATLTAVTQAGEVLGTLAYMSPEQLRGERADVRSDLFALGILAHETLTGEHPFARDSPPDLIAAILSSPPHGLTGRGIPTEVCRALSAMLAKDPQDRPADLDGLLAALRAGPSPPEVPSQPRHRWLAALVLTGLVFGTVVLVRTWPPESPPPAAPSLSNLKVEEYESRAATLVANFSDADSLRQAIEIWQRLLASDPSSARALSGSALARALIAWNSSAGPEVLEEAEGEALHALAIDPDSALANAALSLVYFLQGLPEIAEQTSVRSIELAPSDPQILQLRARLLMDLHGDYEGARGLATRAAEIAPDFYPAWFQLGYAEFELGRQGEADEAFARTIELRPDFSAGFVGRALVQLATGAVTEARANIERALSIDPSSVQASLYLGMTQHALGDARAAERTFAKTVELNTTHPLAAFAHLYRALELDALGRPTERDQELTSAEQMFKTDVRQWRNLVGLAGVAATRGESDTALAWLEKAAAAGLRSSTRLSIQPELAPLRSDDRYQRLVNRLGSSATR